MSDRATKIPYEQTGYFSKLVIDYLNGASALRPFYANEANMDGIRSAIDTRKQFPTDRAGLVSLLKAQYATKTTSEAVQQNIEKLLQENCFVVTTAHQPNLFTGPLYVIYKILHAIRLSEDLRAQMPEYDFVPVFYMGSEDADIDELAHCYVRGEKFEWQTGQTGAFGRMIINDHLLSLLNSIGGQLGVLPFGEAWMQKLNTYFKKGVSIQEATFGLINDLFSEYGLVVLIPDYLAAKCAMIPVFEAELFNSRTTEIVNNTSSLLAQHYKAQATGRDINLFYLDDQVRARIEPTDNGFVIANTPLKFSQQEMKDLLHAHPERFSPNVMLRGIMQETLLPGIAFIGGGGELAYWMQLKGLFEATGVPYPALVLRNSFLLLEPDWKAKIEKLNFNVADFFASEFALLEQWVKRNTKQALTLNDQINTMRAQYEAARKLAAGIDPTLLAHAEALEKRAVHGLYEMEKKMLRAEKRKHTDAERQIKKIKSALFPASGLQERTENLGYFYCKYGPELIPMLYQHSGALEQEFAILTLPG